MEYSKILSIFCQIEKFDSCRRRPLSSIGVIIIKREEKAVVIHAVILVKPRESVSDCEIRRKT